MSTKLAILGGAPVRECEFKSKPFVTPETIDRVSALLREGRLTRFVGSPVPGTQEVLRLSSQDASDLGAGVSVLGGSSVRHLESEWSQIHGVRYSVSVNSATSALIAAVLACDLEPGDGVLCSPFSFTASATAIVAANAVPIFADIDLETFCLSPSAAEAALTERTRAIMPIHWNSNAGDLEGMMQLAGRYDLKVVEDASQSPGMVYQGKHLGTHGDVGVYSLNEPKNIMTGEGGIIVTDDETIAIKCRLIRNHGEAILEEDADIRSIINCIGYNFRLVELLAEIGCEQLKHLETLNQVRRDNYTFLLAELLDRFGDSIIPQKITHPESYFPYTVGLRWISESTGLHRDVVAVALRAEGIPVATGVSRLMSDNPMFTKQIAYGSGHHPFSAYEKDGSAPYSIPPMPNAKHLQKEEYIGFFQIGWPNAQDDMKDIVTAFEKVVAHRDDLARSVKGTGMEAFISGR